MANKILSEIGEELPTASVNKMVIGKTSIDVEILVRDQLDEHLVGTWFNNEKLGDLLKMVVVMSNSAEATDILSLGSDAVGLCDKTVGTIERESLAEEVVRLTKPHMLRGARRGLSKEKKRIINLIDKNTEVKILNLSKDFKGKISDIVRSEKQEIDGVEVSNIYYDVKYALDPGEDHVSVFSYVKMDIQEFGERFGIDTSKAGLDSFNGNVDLEKIITSKKIIRRSRVFYRNGRIYNGSVRYSAGDGKYLTDLKKENVKLVTKTIRNPKIIDEREVMSVREVRSEFNNLSLSISSGNRVSRDNMDPKIVPTYFSPLYHTKDEDDSVRFMFSVNTSEILLRNSVYGPLFSNLGHAKKQDILERSLLRNIEVRRVRVKPASFSANKLETEQMKGDIFDKSMPPVVIVRTGETVPREIREIQTTAASFSEEDIYLSFNRGIEMRSFSGVDKTFAEITDGFYQYEVSVEVSDTIKTYLEEQIAELKSATSTLTEYLNYGTLISPTLEKAEISNPHIDLDVETVGTEAPDKSHYEAYSNKFTRRFERAAKEKYKQPSEYPWIAIPTVIVDLVSGFTSNFPEDKKSQIASSLRHSMSPNTGNPSNILSVIKMIESFTKKVEDIAQLSSKPSVSKSVSASSTDKEVKGTSKSPTRSFTAFKRFDETFDSNMTKNFGFNYLDTDAGSEDDLGLKTISNLEYDDRVDMESERFFSDQDTDINLTLGNKKLITNDSVDATSYSFLTPVSFLDGGVIHDFLDLGQDESVSRRFRRISMSAHAKINSYSFLIERIVTDSKAKNTLERNNILSDEYNVTISPTDQGNSFSYYPEQVRTGRNIVSLIQKISVVEFYDYIASMKSEQMIQPNRFLSSRRENRERRRQIEKKNPFRAARVVSSGISRSRSFVKDPVLKSRMNALKRRTSSRGFSIYDLEGGPAYISSYRWRKMPNQIKAIYLRNSDTASTKVTGEFLEDMSKNYAWEGFMEYKFTIGKIARVSFLSGYDSSKNPRWRTLTKRMYDRLSGKKILCKIEPFSSAAIGYKQTSGFDLNVYNKFFVLDIQREILVQEQDVGELDDDTDGDTPESTLLRRDSESDHGSMSPADLEALANSGGIDRVSDEEIKKMNALQLSKIPPGRRRKISKISTKVSRGNMLCNLISDEREVEEVKGANTRTGVVPNRSMRKTDKEPINQSGDAY